MRYAEFTDDNRKLYMKLYIAGPMRGYADYNFPAFDRARNMLTKWGHEVRSPADMDRELGFDETLGSLDGFDVKAAFKRDMDALFDVEGIYMLHGWENSAGARAEHAVAVVLGLEVLYA